MARGMVRPAAVVSIDLARHSVRTPSDKDRIQQIVQDVVAKALDRTGIQDRLVNYTGDGYLAALLGDDSARLVDFLDSCLPDLRQALSEHKQPVRIGVDYGFIRPRLNSVTSALEHFDAPGIGATRIQSVAGDDQVLCSETVRQVFSPLHPDSFGKEWVSRPAKDRVITACEYFPGLHNLSDDLTDYLLARYQPEDPPGRAMIVEDEANILELLTTILVSRGWKVSGFLEPREAIEAFVPGEVDLVLTDIVMPYMDGFELVRQLRRLDPDLTIVGLSAFGNSATARAFLSAGAVELLLKPASMEDIELSVSRARATAATLKRLEHLGLDAGLRVSLHGIRREVAALELLTKKGDVVTSMVNHKMKHLVHEFAVFGHRTSDATSCAERLLVQLSSLQRLVRAAAAARVRAPLEYVELYLRDLEGLHPKLRIKRELDLGASPADDGGRALLAMVVTELVDNAVDAMKERGRISVRALTLSTSGQLQVVVSDSGPGLPVGREETMFDEGASSKGEGRGLGLHLVREAINRMGGSIRYGFARGARFTIVLPLKAT